VGVGGHTWWGSMMLVMARLALPASS